MDALADRFWEDGFILVRRLFAPEEVATFRARALARTNRRGDLLSDAELRRLLLDQRLLGVVRQLIGEDVVYFGDSSAMIGDTAPGFHKDNVDKDDPNGPDWRGRYPLVRFGVYTQNHVRAPDGLDVRAGSHLHCSTRVGRHVYLQTSPGDVVFWNLRTSHSGGGMTVMGRPLNPESIVGKVMRRLPALRDKPQSERVAMFGTFGAPSPQLDRYIAYLRTRLYAVEGWKASPYDEAALAAARAAGLVVRDMGREIEADPPAVVRAEHVPLPY